jgi:hypothetical protein
MSSNQARGARIARVGASVAVATAILGGSAVAAGYWTDIINNSHAATIDESGKPGNYRIWGLGYAKLIVGGEGNNVLVGDGHCRAGSSDADYCDTGTIAGSGAGHKIVGGGGANAIYSGYGPNEILVGGSGPNYIQSAPTSSTIDGGPDADAIDANQGATTIYAGKGYNVIDAESPQVDHVYCSGTHDLVYAYRHDVIQGCAHVIYLGPSRDPKRHAVRIPNRPARRSPKADRSKRA